MPNQAEEHIVSLVGYCHARPMYVACATGEWADAHGLTVQESLEDPFHLPPPVAPVGDAARRALGVGAARVPEVLLKFPRAGLSNAAMKLCWCGALRQTTKHLRPLARSCWVVATILRVTVS